MTEQQPEFLLSEGKTTLHWRFTQFTLLFSKRQLFLLIKELQLYCDQMKESKVKISYHPISSDENSSHNNDI